MLKSKRFALVLTAAVLAAVLAPAALAAERMDVSGVWSWVHWWDERTLPSGNIIMHGAEIGTWIGSFEGEGYEPFFAVIRPDGSLNAWIRSDFQGSVCGVYGGMTIMITVSMDMAAMTMVGRWVLQHGTGDLKSVHGHGTWIQIAEQAGCYEGYAWVD